MSARPYNTEYAKITDIDKYFEVRGMEMIFIGEELHVYIPMRYEVYQLLDISDTVTTLGIVDLVINNTYRAGLALLSSIEIDPDEISYLTVDSYSYVVLTLTKGSRFICRTDIVKDKSIVYAMFMEFITRGKWLHIFDYDAIAGLFDQAKAMCDASFPVDHAILEVIYSHLARDPKNISVQYRHTDMSGDFEMIPLRSVSYATTSTTSRLMGSYFNDALNAALVSPNEEHHPFEDLLR